MASSEELAIDRSAVFSPDRRYRYALWRWWDRSKGCALFIGLNPSKADEMQDDQTTRRCMHFARDWGYGGICLANLYAFIATHPEDLWKADDPVGDQSDEKIVAFSREAALVVAIWGNDGQNTPRAESLSKLLRPLYCIKETERGAPAHPARLPGSLTPHLWKS